MLTLLWLTRCRPKPAFYALRIRLPNPGTGIIACSTIRRRCSPSEALIDQAYSYGYDRCGLLGHQLRVHWDIPLGFFLLAVFARGDELCGLKGYESHRPGCPIRLLQRHPRVQSQLG